MRRQPPSDAVQPCLAGHGGTKPQLVKQQGKIPVKPLVKSLVKPLVKSLVKPQVNPFTVHPATAQINAAACRGRVGHRGTSAYTPK